MAGKIRLVEFGLREDAKIHGYTFENSHCIVTYVDRICSLTPVQGLQYLAEITAETTCKNGHNIGKPIYFANIICPSEEATIKLLLTLSVKYEFNNGEDLVFFLTEQECDSQKLYFRICEHKFEVKKLLPNIYQEFVTHKEELARLYKTWENFGCETQILVYPTSIYVLQGCVTEFTSTVALDPNKLYLANTPNSIEDVTPIQYKEDSPVSRECFIDGEVAHRIKAAILKEYFGYERMAKFVLFTKQGNSISSSNISYSFDICDGWKGIWVDREISAHREGMLDNLIECHNNSLLIYKLKSDSDVSEDDEYFFEDHPHFDADFARIYTAAELLQIFNNPGKTKMFIERLIRNDNSVI